MSKKILVIGDVMLDHYVYGVVERASPEAPVPILDVQKDEKFLGGAGLVVSNLRNLGAEVSFLSVVGDDEAASEVRKLLSEQQVPDLLAVEAGRKTTLKERFVDTLPAFRMLLRVDRESRHGIKHATEKALLETLGKAAEGTEFIVIPDYNKGMLTKSTIAEVLAFGRENGKKIIVDTKNDIHAYKGNNVILVPNLHELGLAFGQKIQNADPVIQGLATKLSASSGSVVVVKRSEKGASIADGSAFRTHPSMAKEVVNVSGAGDIFVAIFTLALASGRSVDDAVKLANAGCAKAVAKPHPSITKAELPGLG